MVQQGNVFKSHMTQLYSVQSMQDRDKTKPEYERRLNSSEIMLSCFFSLNPIL